jgi:hypothetical protein
MIFFKYCIFLVWKESDKWRERENKKKREIERKEEEREKKNDKSTFHQSIYSQKLEINK